MMMLDLEQYQADLPYPAVRNVHTDKRLAARLMGGYCGASSEMTTVLQYAYHSLRCKKNYDEVSKVMRGIFYVETLHMEFLGECICKLGGDVHYMIELKEKSIYWQSCLVEYKSSPSQMLLADIQGERYAAAFYEETAAMVSQPDIAKLLARLAEDEKLHVRILSDLYSRTFR